MTVLKFVREGQAALVGAKANGGHARQNLSWLKRTLHFVLGDYQIYRIYARDLSELKVRDMAQEAENHLSEFRTNGYDFRPVTKDDIEAAADEDIRSRAFYAGDGAHTYAVYHQSQIVCLQCFWFGERYRQRDFWPLEEGQAKSVEIFTVAKARGKGLAIALKTYTDADMKEKGFNQLLSRVWYSHVSSCRMNEKSGWMNTSIVVEITPFRMGWTMRFVHKL